MKTKFAVLCDKFIEACWLAAVILSPLYMNIYTNRVIEPDKAVIIRSIALLMLLFYIGKLIVPNPKSPISNPQSPIPNSKFQIRNPIIVSLALFAIAYIGSVFFSIAPHNSIWGGYDLLQGLYTNAALWLIFLLTATNLRSQQQINRLVSAIIYTSIPVVLYCFSQKFMFDLLPWQGVEYAARVTGTLGNPIFLAAYLIMVIPLTIARFVYLLRRRKWSRTTISYAVLILLQALTVFLSQSRGPIIGLLVGIFVLGFAYGWLRARQPRSVPQSGTGRSNHKKFLIVVGLLLAFSIIFLGLFNLPHIISFKGTSSAGGIERVWNKTFGKLMDIPYFSRLGRLLETEPGSSGRTRIILWQGVWKLINDKDEPGRFFIGYGPETLPTTYYKYYTMELTKAEGRDMHIDRAHNGYLDIWVTNGLFGLLAYLLLLGSVIYIAIRTILSHRPASSEVGVVSSEHSELRTPYSKLSIDNWVLVSIGLLAAIIGHSAEIFVGIPTTPTLTYFWVFAAMILALSRSCLPVPPRSLEMSGVQGQSPIPAVGYFIATIIIAFILFGFIWPGSTINAENVESTRDTLLTIFSVWLLLGIIAFAILWQTHLFWTYIGQTMIILVVMVKRYWPGDRIIDTDQLIIYVWFWLLFGLIAGAITLSKGRSCTCPNDRATTRVAPTISNILWWLVMLIAVLLVIVKTNLNLSRADGFHKFCESFDITADESARQGDGQKAFQMRLECIRYYQNILRYAPNEEIYLCDNSTNFLRISELLPQQATKGNKITNLPTISEIAEMDYQRFAGFSKRDFFLCGFSCLQQAYKLDPRNFEWLLGMARFYHYWGDLDNDVTKYEKGLEFCNDARKASPNNTKVDSEFDELKKLVDQYK